jgi:hypothetical protein
MHAQSHIQLECDVVENASASLDAHACDSRVSQSLINPSYRVFALSETQTKLCPLAIVAMRDVSGVKVEIEE